MNFSSLRDVTVASFLVLCLAHQRFAMLTASSRGLAIASLFSVVLRFDLVFWYLPNHSSSFRRSWWFMAQLVACNVGTAWCGRTAVGLTVHRPRSTGGWTRLVSGKKIFGAVHVQSRARVRSQNVHRHVLWGCTGSADIWRACSANQKKNKSPASLFFTR